MRRVRTWGQHAKKQEKAEGVRFKPNRLSETKTASFANNRFEFVPFFMYWLLHSTKKLTFVAAS